MFFDKCGNWINADATCNCGAAVQVGDDVIVVDSCGPRAIDAGGITVTIFRNGPLTKGTMIFGNPGRTAYTVCSYY